MKYIKLIAFALAFTSLTACGQENNSTVSVSNAETNNNENIYCLRNDDTKFIDENKQATLFTTTKQKIIMTIRNTSLW
jgi:hypothetical protein